MWVSPGPAADTGLKTLDCPVLIERNEVTIFANTIQLLFARSFVGEKMREASFNFPSQFLLNACMVDF